MAENIGIDKVSVHFGIIGIDKVSVWKIFMKVLCKEMLHKNLASTNGISEFKIGSLKPLKNS